MPCGMFRSNNRLLPWVALLTPAPPHGSDVGRAWHLAAEAHGRGGSSALALVEVRRAVLAQAKCYRPTAASLGEPPLVFAHQGVSPSKFEPYHGEADALREFLSVTQTAASLCLLQGMAREARYYLGRGIALAHTARAYRAEASFLIVQAQMEFNLECFAEAESAIARASNLLSEDAPGVGPVGSWDIFLDRASAARLEGDLAMQRGKAAAAAIKYAVAAEFARGGGDEVCTYWAAGLWFFSLFLLVMSTHEWR
jgi:hypothetical protein